MLEYQLFELEPSELKGRDDDQERNGKLFHALCGLVEHSVNHWSQEELVPRNNNFASEGSNLIMVEESELRLIETKLSHNAILLFTVFVKQLIHLSVFPLSLLIL